MACNILRIHYLDDLGQYVVGEIHLNRFHCQIHYCWSQTALEPKLPIALGVNREHN